MSYQGWWTIFIAVSFFGNIMVAKTLKDISKEQLKLTNKLLEMQNRLAHIKNTNP